MTDDFLERRERLRADPPSQDHTYRCFFFVFDYQTRPDCVRKSPGLPTDVAEQLAGEITALTGELSRRVYARAYAYDRDPNTPAQLASIPPERLAGISGLLCGLLTGHFADSYGELNFLSVEDAFERFANGSIRFAERGRYSE